MKRIAIPLLVGAAITLSLAPSAAALTVGDDLSIAPNEGTGWLSPGATLMVASAGPGSTTGDIYAFPQAGTVTAFRVRTGPDPGGATKGTVKFQVFRPTGSGSAATVVNTKPVPEPVAFGVTGTLGGLSFQVQAGDKIGVHVVNQSQFLMSDLTANILVQNGSYNAGQTVPFTDGPYPGRRLTINAEFTPSALAEPAPSPTPTPDTTAPIASFTALKNGAKKKPFKRFGGGVPADATRVDFALQQVLATKSKAAVSAKSRKKRCKNLKNTNNKFSNAGSCAVSKLIFLSTTFATPGKWIFDLKKNLRPGSYNAFIRAADASGNVDSQFSASRGNKVSFKIARASKS